EGVEQRGQPGVEQFAERQDMDDHGENDNDIGSLAKLQSGGFDLESTCCVNRQKCEGKWSS
ncbi:MAG: hypothetical protein ACLPSF_02430, partial [Methylocella sp.]